MTSNERKIVKCLWEAKGKAHIQLIARQAGLSQDYVRLLCRSLERAGYIKFADTNVCHLLTRGRARFQDTTHTFDDSPEVVMANVEAPQVAEEKIADSAAPAVALDTLKGVSDKEKEKLAEAGYKSVEEVAEAPISKLIQSLGVSLKKAASWINQARRQTGAIDDKKVESKK